MWLARAPRCAQAEFLGCLSSATSQAQFTHTPPPVDVTLAPRACPPAHQQGLLGACSASGRIHTSPWPAAAAKGLELWREHGWEGVIVHLLTGSLRHPTYIPKQALHQQSCCRSHDSEQETILVWPQPRTRSQGSER